MDADASQTPPEVTLLLVEDDKILQDLYSERFAAAGFAVLQAFDGQTALDMAELHPEIRVILLDIMLPKMSGYDVLARLKSNPATKAIPVVMVSALADVDDQVRGLQLGAADYITKGETLPGAVVEKIKQYALPVPGTEEQ